MRLRILSATFAVIVLAACSADPSPTPTVACPTEAPTSTSAQATLADASFATITVTGAVEGEIGIELYGDQAPLATASFVALARCGYYDGVTFHRVIAGFVIQAGDPQTRDNRGDFSGVGTGGPGYSFEIEPPADGLRYDPYVVAMANNTVANGSQFFIDLVDLDDALREEFRSRAIPQPKKVAYDPISLGDERRFDVPVTVIACEFPSSVLVESVSAGAPWTRELAAVKHVEYIDLPTGHWPQFTKPVQLGQAIVSALA